MPASDSLSLDISTGIHLSRQQLRFVKLLEMTASELDEAVAQEMRENPALVASDKNDAIPNDSKTESVSAPFYSSYSQGGEWQDVPQPDSEASLYSNLISQLHEQSLPEIVVQTAEYIIGNLDSNGYLQRSLNQIIDDIAFNVGLDISQATAKAALDAVHNLEPYGIGASNLQECLLIQLKHLPESISREDAIEILTNHFEAFSMKHTHKLISAMKLDRNRIQEAISLILSLNPKPGAGIGSDITSSYIIPDVVVETDDDGKIMIHLNNNIPELSIDTTFEDAYRMLNPQSKEKRHRRGADFISSRLSDAREFIKILSQRQQTLLRVVTAITAIQKDFFTTQDVYMLKPMMIKDIAKLTGLDISVISRATSGKYIATPHGTYPMRFFFSDSIGSERGTEALTNRKVEAEISRLVDNEDKRHPLSDEKIKKAMALNGFDVSRRTIAKYRDRLGIPVARLRKNL